MALNSATLRVFGNGQLYVAPLGTTLPTDVATPPPDPFVGLGFNTEDGLTIAKEVDVTDITAWQSASPLRRVATTQTFTVSGTFLQSDPEVMRLYFGLSEFAGAAGAATADVSADPQTVERAVVVDVVDGAITYRFVIARADVTSEGEFAATRGDAAGYGLSFSALASGTGPLVTLITNDEAHVPEVTP